jgi:hypothetical protein
MREVSGLSRFRFSRIFKGMQRYVAHSEHQLFSADYQILFHNKFKKNLWLSLVITVTSL